MKFSNLCIILKNKSKTMTNKIIDPKYAAKQQNAASHQNKFGSKVLPIVSLSCYCNVVVE